MLTSQFVFLFGVCLAAVPLQRDGVEAQAVSATCTVMSGSGVGPVSGTIKLTQPSQNDNVTMVISLTGFVYNTSTTNQHGFHVHANKSLANSCMAAALHLNLENTTHGAPSDPETARHTGDFGNIQVDQNGNCNQTISDWLAKLIGPTSVIGFPLVIHSDVDDLGRGNSSNSKTTGNAGSRLGCCIITADTTTAAPTAATTPNGGSTPGVSLGWVLVSGLIALTLVKKGAQP